MEAAGVGLLNRHLDRENKQISRESEKEYFAGAIFLSLSQAFHSLTRALERVYLNLDRQKRREQPADVPTSHLRALRLPEWQTHRLFQKAVQNKKDVSRVTEKKVIQPGQRVAGA